MNILSVAYPLFPVTQDSAGGAEQILFLLERGLVAAGHKSVAIAARGSQVSGELLETPAAPGEITDAIREQAHRHHAETIARALKEFRPDLIHFHGLDFAEYVPDAAVIKIATLHLPLDWYPQSIFERGDLVLCCVSGSQARTAPNRLRLPVVANGIEVVRYRADEKRAEYLLWLGRICPEKGTDAALRVAHRLDLPLMLAGPVHPFAYHQAYFKEKVEPLLDDKRLYIGPVALEQKIELLASARCTLIPSLAAETGSLVAMESIASGTPVIAFRSGALPEIVEHGVTGFVGDSEEEMAEAAGRVDAISPIACRECALRRFDSARMVADYVRLYEQLVALP
jgi:glycosyltransferase involved in cell wall biosynthesis